jgi:hypothetical protein
VVLGFAQPLALAAGLAGPAALRLETKLLMPPIAAVRQEQLSAMQTLTMVAFGHNPFWARWENRSKYRRNTGKKTDRKKRTRKLSEAVSEEDGPGRR